MTALCTLLDDGFVIGFKAFIKSLKKWHPEINCDFIVIDVGVSDENKNIMQEYYDNLVFI
jgi:lipopolysaccharide biosynthesis glycosyltransferase